jgi:hypothetical protein
MMRIHFRLLPFFFATVILLLNARLAIATDHAGLTATNVFDRVCIGSQLERDVIQTLTKAFAEIGKHRHQALPDEMLRATNPDNKAGWGITNGKTAVKVSYAEKQAPGFISRSCAASDPSLRYADAIKFVETSYRVQPMGEQQQGSSQVALYAVELLGAVGKKLALSVQSDRVAGTTVIGLFELER